MSAHCKDELVEGMLPEIFLKVLGLVYEVRTNLIRKQTNRIKSTKWTRKQTVPSVQKCHICKEKCLGAVF